MLFVRESNLNGPVPQIPVVPAHVTVTHPAGAFFPQVMPVAGSPFHPVGQELWVMGSVLIPLTKPFGDSIRSGRMYDSSCKSG